MTHPLKTYPREVLFSNLNEFFFGYFDPDFFLIMKTNNFRGDLTDISSGLKEAMVFTAWNAFAGSAPGSDSSFKGPVDAFWCDNQNGRHRVKSVSIFFERHVGSKLYLTAYFPN